MQENLNVAEKPSPAKTAPLNPIVNHAAAQAIFVFSRSWSRAVASRTAKPTSARSLGRS